MMTVAARHSLIEPRNQLIGYSLTRRYDTIIHLPNFFCWLSFFCERETADRLPISSAITQKHLFRSVLEVCMLQ